MSKSIRSWLDPKGCPPERPSLEAMTVRTRELHDSIDDHIRRTGVPYLHPHEKTLQLDLLGSRRVVEWQEGKVKSQFIGDLCWSELPQLYARYGTRSVHMLLAKVRKLEGATAAVACDSGMQAIAVVLDVVMEPGSHLVAFRQVYNKTAKYISWLCERSQCEHTIVDDGDYQALQSAIRPNTRVVFAETYSNPLMRALDLSRVPRLVAEAREKAPGIKLVVDTTIATPWGVKKPVLESGADVVIFSGTKALGGRDLDLAGFIATNDNDLANAVMDLLAMRGGILDWRRADAFLAGFEHAANDHQRRCQNASVVAAFLQSHPRVRQVFHPSLSEHVDADVISKEYQRTGSLLSFRVKTTGEDAARRLCDVLATCTVIRYALSFDGLVTKVNHHKSVSEYFTPDESVRRNGLDELIRIGVGVEDPYDLCAALNWALHHYLDISEFELDEWRKQRALDLQIEDSLTDPVTG